MRILFFADNFPPEVNAPATHIFERCRIWVRQGHQVTVITCAPNFPQGKVYAGYRNRLRQVEEIDGIRVVRVWSYIAPNAGVLRRAIDYASYVPTSVLASLCEQRPDVIISSSPQLLAPVAGLIVSFLRWRPHVFELRDLWPASMVATGALKKGSALRMLERLELAMYRASARVLAFTESFRDDLTARGISPEKIDVVYGGASDQITTASPSDGRDPQLEAELQLEGRMVIGYLGTLGLAHGLTNVVIAAEHLRDEPVTFLFIGEGAAKEALVDIVRQRKLPNVVFVAAQPKAELGRYWSLCDVALVHLSNDPVFATVVPSKIFEAMSMGKPILYAGPIGEASHIIEQHDAGICLPAMQTKELADAVRTLKSDSNARGHLAKNSLAAAQHYTRQRHAERTLDVLQQAAASRRDRC